MKRPFEADELSLREHLEEFVNVTIADLGSEFLLLPKGEGFIEYPDFRDAYEVLKHATGAFANLTLSTVRDAVVANSRVFGVVRAILGMTPPEWADLARMEVGSDVTQGAARNIDRSCRADPQYLQRLTAKAKPSITHDRIEALLSVAVKYLSEGAPDTTEGIVHRLDKFDTKKGLP